MEYGDDRDYNRCDCQPAIEKQLYDIDTHHLSGLVLGFGLATLIRPIIGLFPDNVEDWVWFGIAVLWLIPCRYVYRRYQKR